MNVLIINLTRFGDLIQTQPVISGYTGQGHQVGLICLDNFSVAASLLDGVEAVFSFPGARLLAGLDEDWRTAVASFADFQAQVHKDFPADRVVNLTPSISSRLLTRALVPESGEVVGFSVDEYGFNADTSAWAAFLQLAGANRGASPFNICDIFRRTAGLGDEGNSLVLGRPDSATLAKTADLLSSHAPEEGKGYLALQMGASEERRRWPVARFVRLAELAWENERLVPVLLGTGGETHLAERFRAATNCPAVNLVGKTSLSELAAVLKHCRALVTNDTGTMHLAAGMGVPICAIFLATAQPWDTGPYRAGNICLEPDIDCHPCEFGAACPNDHVCREAVSSETMHNALRLVLGVTPSMSFTGARVWRTETGADGLMGLASLSGHDRTDRALWIAIQRAHYLAFLDGAASEKTTGAVAEMSSAMKEELSKTLTMGHDMLFLLSKQGMLLSRNPRPQAKAKFLASWQRFQMILSGDKYLNILGKLWMFETQRCGNDLSSLLSLTSRYQALIASLISELN